MAKAFAEFISFLTMSKINSFSDVTEILSIAEYFRPRFKNFRMTDPYKITVDFLLWGLHEEVN